MPSLGRWKRGALARTCSLDNTRAKSDLMPTRHRRSQKDRPRRPLARWLLGTSWNLLLRRPLADILVPMLISLLVL